MTLGRPPAPCDRAPPSSPSRARKSCRPRPEQRQTEEATSGQTSCAGHFNHSNIVEKKDYGTLEMSIHLCQMLIISNAAT